MFFKHSQILPSSMKSWICRKKNTKTHQNEHTANVFFATGSTLSCVWIIEPVQNITVQCACSTGEAFASELLENVSMLVIVVMCHKEMTVSTVSEQLPVSNWLKDISNI